MYIGSINEEFFNDLMVGLSQLSRYLRKTLGSDEYHIGLRTKKLNTIFRSGVSSAVSEINNIIYSRIMHKRLEKKVTHFKRESSVLEKANYFSQERIAVYTCILGKYDPICEPMCHPNNIDYYIITDNMVENDSSWKRIDLDNYKDRIQNLSNVEKNRWFKMHPSEVFNDYKYSIYIDGNIIPITDFTEFVNRLGNCGIAMFWHRYNNCVYQEALYNKYSVRKTSNDAIEKHIEYLKSKGMPENFGMTTCNVIVREHNNPVCKRIMDDWWNEFMNHCKRDQISFPYVVWKNGIKMSDIALLGDDVWDADQLLIVNHNTYKVKGNKV